jgi:hypothetical protein
MVLPMRKYPAAVSLLILLGTLLLYRVTFYAYPDQRPQRNPLDFAWDVCGYSYHFMMLAVDIGQGDPTLDYHARQALRYKPGDTYISRFIPAGGAKQ